MCDHYFIIESDLNHTTANLSGWESDLTIMQLSLTYTVHNKMLSDHQATLSAQSYH